MTFSLEKDCTACGGTGKETSDAVRAALETSTEVRKALGCGSYINAGDLHKIVRAAVGEFIRVSEHDADQGEIPPPAVRQTWSASDHEPGPEVTAVKDCDGDVWSRSGHGWIVPGFRSSAVDWDAVVTYVPLEDWTHEVD